MVIVYDYHEDSSPVPGLLERLGVPLVRDTRKVGDYEVSGLESLVVERKEAGDYVGSLKDGTLHTQLYEMSTNYPYSILLVEGNVTHELMQRKMRRQQLISSLAGSILKRSPDGQRGVISMVNLDTAWDTALFLKYAHEKVNAKEGLVRAPVMTARKWKPEDRQVGVLAAFPGVGEVTARAIMSEPRLNTLRKIMTAEADELCRVEGVGPKTAMGIMNLSRKVYRV